MFRHKLYLDTCILIGFYYEKDRWNKKTMKFLEEISKIKNMDLVLSDYVITEFAKCYSDKLGVAEKDVWKTTSNLTHLKTIGKKYSFKFLSVKGKEKKYTFSTFFIDVREIIMNCAKRPRIHLADAIHCSIMKNNNVRYIVTTDVDDFKGVEKIKALDLDEVIDFFKKKKKK